MSCYFGHKNPQRWWGGGFLLHPSIRQCAVVRMVEVSVSPSCQPWSDLRELASVLDWAEQATPVPRRYVISLAKRRLWLTSLQATQPAENITGVWVGFKVASGWETKGKMDLVTLTGWSRMGWRRSGEVMWSSVCWSRNEALYRVFDLRRNLTTLKRRSQARLTGGRERKRRKVSPSTFVMKSLDHCWNSSSCFMMTESRLWRQATHANNIAVDFSFFF